MEKYIICPYCQTKNPRNLFQCTKCQEELYGLTPKKETVKIRSITDSHEDINPNVVKVCDVCGTKNPTNVRKCENCDNDISDVIPSNDSLVSSKGKPQFFLKSIDGKHSFEITTETIVGKEHSMGDYLHTKGYVSRTHAKLMIDENGLYIENLSKTNPTFINNIELSEKTRLNDGDEIGFGGKVINGKRQEKAAYFIVRIS